MMYLGLEPGPQDGKDRQIHLVICDRTNIAICLLAFAGTSLPNNVPLNMINKCVR